MILSPYRRPEDISTGDTVLVVNQGHNTNRLYCTVVEITSNDNGSYGGTIIYPGSWALLSVDERNRTRLKLPLVALCGLL